MNGIVSAIQGRLSRDADFRYSGNGTAMLRLNVAVNDDKRKEGDPTEWVAATAWGDTAERLNEQLASVLTKGREVYLEGRLRLRGWTTSEGIEKQALELAVWKCQPIGAIGRQASPPRSQEQSSRRMSEWDAVHGDSDQPPL